MAWVWQHSRAKGNQRFVLLAIADCANAEGAEAWPSTSELVRKTGLSERTVQGAIKALVELGELEVTPHGGPGKRNRYRVLMNGPTPADSAPANPAPADSAGAESAPSGGKSCGEPPQNLPHHPAESAPHSSVLIPSSSVPVPSTSDSARKARTRERPKTRIPDDFAVTDSMRAWAAEKGIARVIDIDVETENFVDYYHAAGTKWVDWTRVWQRWMRTAAERARERLNGTGNTWAAPPARPSRPSTTDQRVAAALALAEKYRQEES